jgi:hypothetical protein
MSHGKKGKGKIKAKNKICNPRDYWKKVNSNFSLRIAGKIHTTAKFFNPTFICLNEQGMPIKVRHGIDKDSFLKELDSLSYDAIYEWRPIYSGNEYEIWGMGIKGKGYSLANCYVRWPSEKFESVSRRHESHVLKFMDELQVY